MTRSSDSQSDSDLDSIRNSCDVFPYQDRMKWQIMASTSHTCVVISHTIISCDQTMIDVEKCEDIERELKLELKI